MTSSKLVLWWSSRNYKTIGLIILSIRVTICRRLFLGSIFAYTGRTRIWTGWATSTEGLRILSRSEMWWRRSGVKRRRMGLSRWWGKRSERRRGKYMRFRIISNLSLWSDFVIFLGKKLLYLSYKGHFLLYIFLNCFNDGQGGSFGRLVVAVHAEELQNL